MKKMEVRVSKNCQVTHQMVGYTGNACYSVADKIKDGAKVFVSEHNSQVQYTGGECMPEGQQGQFNPN